jgi:4-amino-4-deoxy-L-arabinose transferase-like glycosyltransferase
VKELKSRPFVVVLILAVALRVGLLTVLRNHLDRATRPDSGGYQYIASNVWTDLWSRQTSFLYWTLLRTPGYPLMLAALRQQTFWVIVVQIVISIVLVIVVYRLALESIGETGALIAAAIVAFEPNALAYDYFLLSEVPFTLGLTLGMLWWLRGLRQQSWRWLACAGVALGVATLVRPVSLYLLLVLLPITAVMMRRHAPVIACVVLAVAFAMPVGTWVARNEVLTGHPVFSTIQAYDLADYRGAYAIVEEDKVTLNHARRSIHSQVTAPDSDPVLKADQLTKAGVAALLAHPRGWVVVTVIGAAKVVLGPGLSDWTILLGSHGPLINVIGYLTSVVLFLLALIGGVLGLRGRRWDLLAMTAVVAYVVAVSSGGESYSRMRVPIEPLQAILAAYAVVALGHRWLHGEDRAEPRTPVIEPVRAR